jgi:DNA uptake protein ComE-like DNA-binding protein
MSGAYNRPDRPPHWLWLSLIPVLGGLAIAHAGQKTHNQSWLSVGLAFTVMSCLLHTHDMVVVLWLSQVGMGLYVRQKITANPSRLGSQAGPFPPRFSPREEKIDLNTCSKHELVYQLGLPIVYANDIDSVRQEGHIFTHIEELSEIAGLPENYARTIAPMITFRYDVHKEIETSWRCLNSYSERELMTAGIEASIAQRIIVEREKNGVYRSAIEVRNRTGIPLRSYQRLL